MPPRYDTWREHTIMCARESWLEKKGLAEAKGSLDRWNFKNLKLMKVKVTRKTKRYF